MGKKGIEKDLLVLGRMHQHRTSRVWVTGLRVGVLWLLLDQCLKFASAMTIGEQAVPFWGADWFQLTHSFSPFVTDGWGQFRDPRFFAVLLAVFFALFLMRIRRVDRGELIAFALILAGALSNLIDWATVGQGVESFQLVLGSWRIRFSLADFGIWAGLIQLLWLTLTKLNLPLKGRHAIHVRRRWADSH